MKDIFKVAIDGPSGAGKSTISESRSEEFRNRLRRYGSHVPRRRI